MAGVEQASGWDEFVDQFAWSAGVAAVDVTGDARLVADLGLDSLALAEVIVGLIEKYAPPSLVRDVDGREWERLTVGELYSECVRAGNEGPSASHRQEG